MNTITIELIYSGLVEFTLALSLVSIVLSLVRRTYIYVPLVISIYLCIVGIIAVSTLFYVESPYILITIVEPVIGIGRLDLVLNTINAVFLLSFTLIGIPVVFYSLEYLTHHHKHEDPRHYWFYLSTSYLFTLIYLLSNNFLIFLFSLDAMIVFLGLLIAFDRTYVRARVAARIYIIMGLLASALIIMSLSIIFFEIGVFSFTELREKIKLADSTLTLLSALILGLIGFAIKSGIVPFHSWLPLAHAEAPTPISALLSGFIVNTGIYGTLMLTTSVNIVNDIIVLLITLLGLTSVIYGAVMALAQDDIKRLFAYSTISYMGYVFVMVASLHKYVQPYNMDYKVLGVVILSSILLFLLNHSIAKATLFFIAGNIISHIGTRNINRMGGLYKEMKLDYIALLFASMVLIGLPPTIGFQSKVLYHTSVLGSGHGMPLLELSIAIFSTVLTTSYLLKPLYKGFIRDTVYTKYYKVTVRYREKIPGLMVYPLYILVLSAFIIGLWWEFVLAMIKSSGVYMGVPIEYILNSLTGTLLIIFYTPPTISVFPNIITTILAIAITPLSLLIGFWLWTHIEKISYEFHKLAHIICHVYVLNRIRRTLYSTVNVLEAIEDNYRFTLVISLTLLLVLVITLLS